MTVCLTLSALRYALLQTWTLVLMSIMTTRSNRIDVSDILTANVAFRGSTARIRPLRLFNIGVSRYESKRYAALKLSLSVDRRPSLKAGRQRD